MGITDLPDPVPHPDHVKIDFIEETVTIVGPTTKEEKADYDWFVERRTEYEDELLDLRNQRSDTTDKELITQLDEKIR